jgi:hypothetical protein
VSRGCVKRFSPPAAAKCSLDGDIFFLILRSKIRKKMSPSKFNLARSAKKNLFTQPQDFIGGCVKSLSPPAAAEYSSERHVIFTISLREIVKMTCLSKHNSARSAVKNLFTQPLSKYNLARSAVKILFVQPQLKNA